MKKTHKLTPMKKAIILAAIPMLALFANPSCAQHRYADLRVKIIDPPPYSIFYSPTVLHYAFEVVNQGPDSLWPMDSMYYIMVHTGGGSRPKTRIKLNKYVVPGDSFIVYDSIGIDYWRDEDDFEIRFSYTPAMFSHDYGSRNLWSEFHEDTKDNSASLPLKHRRILSAEPLQPEEIRVYPNPCTTGRLTLAGPQISDLRITDVLGRGIAHRRIEQQGQATVVEVFPHHAGMYTVEYRTPNKIIRQKIYLIPQ